LQVPLQVASRSDEREAAAGAGRELVGAGREVECPRQQAAPGARRPSGGDPEQGDVIAPVVVPFDVRVPGHLRRGGQDLQADVPLDQPGDVNLTPVAAPPQVAPPEQRIGVQVDHLQPAMELERTWRRRVRRLIRGRAEASFCPGDHRPSDEARPERDGCASRNQAERASGHSSAGRRQRLGVMTIGTG
jgi:hypothetical protein